MYKDNEEIAGKKLRPGATVKPTSNADVKFGIRPRSLTDQERGLVATRRGVVVTYVENGSFAQEAGLEENDIIDSINRQPVDSLDDVKKVQQSLKPGDPVAFHVVRRSALPGRNRGKGPADTQSLYLAGSLPEN
jgi:serine protease Do